MSLSDNYYSCDPFTKNDNSDIKTKELKGTNNLCLVTDQNNTKYY
jgi:hypothetical protein